MPCVTVPLNLLETGGASVEPVRLPVKACRRGQTTRLQVYVITVQGHSFESRTWQGLKLSAVKEQKPVVPSYPAPRRLDYRPTDVTSQGENHSKSQNFGTHALQYPQK